MSDPNETMRIMLDDPNAEGAVGLRDRVTLTVLTGASFGQFFRLTKDEMVLGRSVECDIHLDESSVSRRHARIVRRGLLFFIEDLGSANGTLVDGEPPTSKRPLTEGQKIALGQHIILRFSYSDEVDEAYQQKLYEAALRDGLTGIYNKRYLWERVRAELAFARRHKTPVSLLLFDLDRFKVLNDTYGHLAGDEVLACVAHLLTRHTRTEDVVGRYGGEEFVVLCRGIDHQAAMLLADRLRVAIGTLRIPFDGHALSATVSGGVATFPDSPAADAEALLGYADVALYAAKDGGRDQVRSANDVEALLS